MINANYIGMLFGAPGQIKLAFDELFFLFK